MSFPAIFMQTHYSLPEDFKYQLYITFSTSVGSKDNKLFHMMNYISFGLPGKFC